MIKHNLKPTNARTPPRVFGKNSNETHHQNCYKEPNVLRLQTYFYLAFDDWLDNHQMHRNTQASACLSNNCFYEIYFQLFGSLGCKLKKQSCTSIIYPWKFIVMRWCFSLKSSKMCPTPFIKLNQPIKTRTHASILVFEDPGLSPSKSQLKLCKRRPNKLIYY